jgi:Na+/melibiose symporter-like transporter
MPGMPVMAQRTSGMAIAGFVLAFFCGLLGLIFSIIGYNECKRSNGSIGGEGLAVAGIVISIVSMLIGISIAASR